MRHVLILLAVLSIASPVGAAEPAPVVVELYTSQSCSSCPPADTILADIAHNPDSHLIVLGCHVDYWDHLRWKDTLSLYECTERQRDYGAVLEQGRTYTPNMIVNGRQSFIGSRRDDLESALRKARLRDDVVPITVTMTQDGFTLGLPQLPGGQQIPYELSLLTYRTNQTVKIGAGENGGKTITYAHAVSGIIRLDPWQGREETRIIPIFKLPQQHLHGVVVLAQAVRGGPVKAAGEYRIYFN